MILICNTDYKLGHGSEYESVEHENRNARSGGKSIAIK